MATYILLGRYTAQGLKDIKKTTQRAQTVKQMAAKAGLNMKETYWTLGQYDVVAVFEAPDDEAMTAFALSVARSGNVTTQTMRAFASTEMDTMLSKVS